MADQLIVVAQMKAKPGLEEELRRRTLALVEPTRREKGCIQYDLHVADVDPSRVLFYEIWTSREALDTHLKTPHLTEFLGWAGEGLAEPALVETFTKIA